MDIQTVINLRDGWKYILTEIPLTSLTLDFINKVNEHVSRNESLDSGKLRYGNVGISGTDYIPSIPEKNSVENYLDSINAIPDPTERVISYFISAIKKQLYWGGNKRTSLLVANAVLISNGRGVLTIQPQKCR